MSAAAEQFDADEYKRTQHEQWNEDAAAWARWAPALRQWLGEATRLRIDQAQLRLGQRVLDIAAGAGELLQ